MPRQKNSNPQTIPHLLSNTIAEKVKQMEEKTEAFKKSFQLELTARMEGSDVSNSVEPDSLSDSIHAVHSRQKSIKKDLENFRFRRLQKIQNHLLSVTRARKSMFRIMKEFEKRNREKDISKIIIDNTISTVRMQHEDGQTSHILKKTMTKPVSSTKQKAIVSYKVYPKQINIRNDLYQ
ncbi:hypothetical protein LSTR_LSTR013762 [Laodelphax striatellus]|uniref:Uncharacterized protein n=1 Tax=Laodelphax striatellus TaxID=195883 RepID=A0A482WKP3_LAOST|nr:hypothetical protein LSTR_LSTR013762 [Laodelphax striatellus]